MNVDLGYYDEEGGRKLRFFYKNWRGDSAYRTIKGVPVFWFGQTAYHKEPQWFIKAYDVDKDAVRDFALLDIIEFVK